MEFEEKKSARFDPHWKKNSGYYFPEVVHFLYYLAAVFHIHVSHFSQTAVFHVHFFILRFHIIFLKWFIFFLLFGCSFWCKCFHINVLILIPRSCSFFMLFPCSFWCKCFHINVLILFPRRRIELKNWKARPIKTLLSCNSYTSREEEWFPRAAFISTLLYGMVFFSEENKNCVFLTIVLVGFLDKKIKEK